MDKFSHLGQMLIFQSESNCKCSTVNTRRSIVSEFWEQTQNIEF